MGSMASQITSLTIVYSPVYSDADQRKHQSSASLAFARGIHRGPVKSPHKWRVTRKMFPFDYVIMSIRPCVFIHGILSCTIFLYILVSFGFDHNLQDYFIEHPGEAREVILKTTNGYIM